MLETIDMISFISGSPCQNVCDDEPFLTTGVHDRQRIVGQMHIESLSFSFILFCVGYYLPQSEYPCSPCQTHIS